MEQAKLVIDGTEMMLEHEDLYELFYLIDAEVRKARRSVHYRGVEYEVNGATLTPTCYLGVAVEVTEDGFRVLGEKNGKMVSFGTEISFDDAHERARIIASRI